jgi:hypothetical protein
MIKALVIVGILTFLLFGLGGCFVSTMNKEVSLRNLITAKQSSNKVEFDNMWKKNTESFQITQAQKDALYDIIVGNSKARAGNGNGGSLAQLVHEAVPNLDNTTALYQQLMNTVVASRNEWTRKQNEILDMKREHDNLIDMFPSSLVCSILGRQKIDVKIVTSGRTEEAFDSGQDNQVGFDQAPKKAEK